MPQSIVVMSRSVWASTSVKIMSSGSGVAVVVDPDEDGVMVGSSVVPMVVPAGDGIGAVTVGARVVGVPVGALVGEQWPHTTRQDRLT